MGYRPNMRIYIELITALLLLSSLPTVSAAGDQSAPPLVVGVALPLSGPIAASMGQAVQNGITLFTEQQSAQAKNLQLVTEDTTYDGKQAISAVRKLVDTDKAKLVMVWGNTPASATAPVLEALKIRSAYVSHDDHTSNNSEAVDLGPSGSACLAPLAAKVKQIGTNNFGAIGIDVGSVVSWLDVLDKEVGVRLSREIVSSDAAQFQTQLLKGKAKGIKTYLLAMMPEQALILARQAKQLNISISVIGIDAFSDDAFLKQLTQLQPDVSLISGGVEPWFKRSYRNRFGNGAFLLEAASGYVFAQLAAHVSARVSSQRSLADMVKDMPMKDLAYANAQLSSPGLRLSAPCSIVTAADYLAE